MVELLLEHNIGCVAAKRTKKIRVDIRHKSIKL